MMRSWQRVLAIVALAIVFPSCAPPARSIVPSGAAAALREIGSRLHFVAGFGIDTPSRAAIAAGEGVTTAIEYSEVPADGTLAKALVKNGISVIDATVYDDLYYWECHRTRTVASPPSGYTNCSEGDGHEITSTAALLRHVKALLARDARNAPVRTS